MANRKLTPDEISILSRGLKFTPTPEKRNFQEVKTDINEFHIKLRLKEYFHENEYEDDGSLVRNKSSFEPKRGRNIALDKFITITKELPLSQLPTDSQFNITLNERNCISDLQNNESIITKEADKGGGIVIMNREYYKTKMLEMLGDNSFYRQANDDCSKTTFKKIKSLIKLSGDVTRHEIDYLLNFEFK